MFSRVKSVREPIFKVLGMQFRPSCSHYTIISCVFSWWDSNPRNYSIFHSASLATARIRPLCHITKPTTILKNQVTHSQREYSPQLYPNVCVLPPKNWFLCNRRGSNPEPSDAHPVRCIGCGGVSLSLASVANRYPCSVAFAEEAGFPPAIICRAKHTTAYSRLVAHSNIQRNPLVDRGGLSIVLLPDIWVPCGTRTRDLRSHIPTL